MFFLFVGNSWENENVKFYFNLKWLTIILNYCITFQKTFSLKKILQLIFIFPLLSCYLASNIFCWAFAAGTCASSENHEKFLSLVSGCPVSDLLENILSASCVAYLDLFCMRTRKKWSSGCVCLTLALKWTQKDLGSVPLFPTTNISSEILGFLSYGFILYLKKLSLSEFWNKCQVLLFNNYMTSGHYLYIYVLHFAYLHSRDNNCFLLNRILNFLDEICHVTAGDCSILFVFFFFSFSC